MAQHIHSSERLEFLRNAQSNVKERLLQLSCILLIVHLTIIPCTTTLRKCPKPHRQLRPPFLPSTVSFSNGFWGASLDFFAPDTVLTSFVPNAVRNPRHDMLFQQLGGSLLNIAFIDAVLLRYTADLVVWKIVQRAVLLVDVTGLYSLWAALSQQGRLNPAVWRGEDWGCVGITGLVTVVRILFIVEVGFRSRRAAMKHS